MKLLAPFKPTASDPWDVAKAAHLCRRAGFGAPRKEVEKVLELGPEGAVERFLHVDPQRDEEYRKLFEMNQRGFIQFQAPQMLQAWWLFRMQNDPFPLREKMTLFWHGHFATSFHKVEDMRMMHEQNETLRRGALGDFRDLVLNVSRDPAMIRWLDNQENFKEHPNENFARELMELFTLGEGHYTEHDVREATRAFTGWHLREQKFFFDADAHDFGRKKVLGHTGRFDGRDVVDILLQEDQAKRYLARKIIEFFVMPEPSEALVAEAADVLTRCNLEMRWFMRALFQSKAFYSPEAYRSKIKSPVEFSVGAVRDLDGVFPGQELAELTHGMGQELFAPPSVKGWDGERDWIASNAWLVRGQFAENFSHAGAEFNLGSSLPLETHVPFEESDPQIYVDYYLDRLVQGEVSPETRQELRDYMTRLDEFNDEDAEEGFRREIDFRVYKIRGLIRLILTLSEYHLC